MKNEEMFNTQLDSLIDKAEKDLEEGNYIDFDSLDEMRSFLMKSAQDVIQRRDTNREVIREKLQSFVGKGERHEGMSVDEYMDFVRER